MGIRSDRHCHVRRPAYTLVELVASIVATGILMAGMGSVLFVAAQSTDENTTSAMQIAASATAHEILSDLQFAKSFVVRSSTAVEFTVATRDLDATDETIRYAWSGTPGDPLTRQYNLLSSAIFIDNVHVFQYTDHVETVTEFGGTQKHYVYQGDIRLQIGNDPTSLIVAGVKTLNAPEVPAP